MVIIIFFVEHGEVLPRKKLKGDTRDSSRREEQ